MAIVSTQQEQVVIRFTVIEGDLSYTDALYKSAAEWAALQADPEGQAKLTAEQQARFDHWKAVLNTPGPEPTPEEQEAKLIALKEQFSAIKEQILTALPDDGAKLAFIQEREAIVSAEIVALQQAIAGRG